MPSTWPGQRETRGTEFHEVGRSGIILRAAHRPGRPSTLTYLWAARWGSLGLPSLHLTGTPPPPPALGLLGQPALPGPQALAPSLLSPGPLPTRPLLAHTLLPAPIAPQLPQVLLSQGPLSGRPPLLSPLMPPLLPSGSLCPFQDSHFLPFCRTLGSEQLQLTPASAPCPLSSQLTLPPPAHLGFLPVATPGCPSLVSLSRGSPSLLFLLLYPYLSPQSESLCPWSPVASCAPSSQDAGEVCRLPGRWSWAGLRRPRAPPHSRAV